MDEKSNKLKAYPIGVLLAITFLIVSSLLIAVTAKMTPASENIIKIAVYTAISLAGICGGIICGKCTQRRGVLCGALVGVLFLMLVKLLELISTGNITFNSGFYVSSLCMFASSVFGGILGVN